MEQKNDNLFSASSHSVKSDENIILGDIDDDTSSSSIVFDNNNNFNKGKNKDDEEKIYSHLETSIESNNSPFAFKQNYEFDKSKTYNEGNESLLSFKPVFKFNLININSYSTHNEENVSVLEHQNLNINKIYQEDETKNIIDTDYTRNQGGIQNMDFENGKNEFSSTLYNNKDFINSKDNEEKLLIYKSKILDETKNINEKNESKNCSDSKIKNIRNDNDEGNINLETETNTYSKKIENNNNDLNLKIKNHENNLPINMNMDYDKMFITKSEDKNRKQSLNDIKNNKETFIDLINDMEVEKNGKIKNKSFAKEILLNAKRNVFTKSFIDDSYLPSTEWYSLNINDNGIIFKNDDGNEYELVLIRISNLTPPVKYFEELIQKEYLLNKQLLENDFGISLNFIGYSMFTTKAVSIFFTQSYSTLKEYAESKNMKDIVIELVEKLSLIHDNDGICFISPTLSPNNILWSNNDLYSIIFTEIFLSIDSVDGIINIEKIPTKEWFVPEFKQLNDSKQCTLSYHSSIHSFTNILYYLLSTKYFPNSSLKLPKSNEEWNKFFCDNSNNIRNREFYFFSNIIKECININEKEPVRFCTILQKLNDADPAIFEESFISDQHLNISNDNNFNNKINNKESNSLLSIKVNIDNTSSSLFNNEDDNKLDNDSLKRREVEENNIEENNYNSRSKIENNDLDLKNMDQKNNLTNTIEENNNNLKSIVETNDQSLNSNNEENNKESLNSNNEENNKESLNSNNEENNKESLNGKNEENNKESLNSNNEENNKESLKSKNEENNKESLNSKNEENNDFNIKNINQNNSITNNIEENNDNSKSIIENNEQSLNNNNKLKIEGNNYSEIKTNDSDNIITSNDDSFNSKLNFENNDQSLNDKNKLKIEENNDSDIKVKNHENNSPNNIEVDYNNNSNSKLNNKNNDQSLNNNENKNSNIVDLINNLDIEKNGKIKNKNFAKEILLNAKKNIFTKLLIDDSYLPDTEWYSLNINNNGIIMNIDDGNDYELVLIRISNIIQSRKNFEELIQKEYFINRELFKEEITVSPKFIGYSIFQSKVVSIFFTQFHCTLKEYAKSNSLKDIVKELIEKLYFVHNECQQCFITPTLSPNNILWSNNDLYSIIFTEIFLSIDSLDETVNIKEIPIQQWFVPEFKQLNDSKQCKLSYYSSVHSFGYVLYYLLIMKYFPNSSINFPKSNEEWCKFFIDSSKNTYNREFIFFKNIIKECINANEKEPTKFDSILQKLNDADPVIFEEPIITNQLSNIFNENNFDNSDRENSSSMNMGNNDENNSSMNMESNDERNSSMNMENNDERNSSMNMENNDERNSSTIPNTKCDSQSLNDNTENRSSQTPNIENTSELLNENKKIEIKETNDDHINNLSNNIKVNNDDISSKSNIENSELESKYLDGFIFKGINDNTKTIIYFIHLDVELEKQIDFDIEVYDLNRPYSKGYKLLKYEFDNNNNTKYFSVVPFYLYNGMKTIDYGVRGVYDSNIELNLVDTRLSKVKNCNKYVIKLTNTKRDRNINIYKPYYKNELSYLRQISLINPKNYEYSNQYIVELTDSLLDNDLVDIVLKTGFNDFTEIIISILGSRKFSLSDISKHIEANYKIKSKEYENAPKLLHKLIQCTKSTSNLIQKKDKEHHIYIGEERNKLLCDSEFLYLNKTNEKVNIIADTIKNMDMENIDYLDYINEEYCNKKIEEYNNSSEGQKRKLNVISTNETIKKIKLISVGILSNIAIIIQGFTSAGKSFISTVSSVIHRGQYPIATALSENTTVEDLLGRFVLQRKESSMMSFIPGILLTAYTEGRILVLDECDLAKPEVLSCILRSISNDEIIVNNTVYKKMRGYNVILTMNGEIEGFTKNQRNELTSNILSKFVIVKFDKMSKNECENIFKELIPDSDNFKNYVSNFVNLHEEMLEYKQKTIDPIVTLRNLKACTYLSKANIPVRFSAEIAYTGRFPRNERDTFEDIIRKFGNNTIDKNIKEAIIEKFNEDNLYYDDSYLKCAYLALAACKAGLHPLLIGENGSGLTELAKFVACNYTCSTDTFLRDNQRKHIELIHLGSETSIDDLLGCFQPSIEKKEEENKNTNKGVDLTKLISWTDGPVLKAGKKGYPVILDKIDCAKAQVLECLNPLLEDNSVFNNVQFKLIEKDNKEQINIAKGFVVIGTMGIDDGEDVMSNISKALMNRFVAIYLDKFSLNSEAIEKITEKAIKKIKAKLEYNINTNSTFINNANSYSYIFGSSDINNKGVNNIPNIKKEFDNDNDDEESDNEDYTHFLDTSDEYEDENITSENKDEDDNIQERELYIPDWYKIINFSNEKINDISKFVKNLKFSNIKSLIKTIAKLCYIIQRTDMDISDSYTLLKLNENIYNLKNINDLISKLLKKDTSNNNKFFYDNEEKGNAKKMILSLISCDLSCSPIFIQGSPGSGKSVAARHYGGFRQFRSRDPILSISCNSDISFEQFVGTFSFKNTSFQFVEGPLITAMRNGEPILIDEFNLCSEEVLLNLLPLLKAEINDYVKLKGVPYQVQIKQGFVFIATGNDDHESGRKKMPQSILNELIVVKISNPKISELNGDNKYLDEYKSLLGEIINNEYKECSKYITPNNICDIIQVMETIAQQSFSLRQIKCLLNRIKRFCTGKLPVIEISSDEYKKIPVAYVIIGFIIPNLKIGPERIKQIVERIGDITNIDSNELLEFIKSDALIVNRGIDNRGNEKYYIKKGKILLSTSMKIGVYPPIMLQTYFWIRMSCSLYSDTPSQETLILEGPTSYKSYLLEKWLKFSTGVDSYEEHFVTKNTETQDLIGLSTLDDKEKISRLINSLLEKAIMYLSDNSEYIEGGREEKLKSIMEELEVDGEGKITNKCNICLEYIYRCIKELINLEENYDKHKGIKTMTSFNLGIISSACIFGQRLIIKGIDQISPSVIERINSVLEYPRSLVLTEDTQGIFNNQQIFNNLYNCNRRSIPISENFSIYFTSREVFNGRLSEAFRSRCTTIICPSYDNKLYLGIKLDTFENYSSIVKSIITKNGELQKSIIELYKRIYKNYRIPILSFIRWCTTTEKLNSHLKGSNINHIVGISILRSIFDGYEPNMRIMVIKEVLYDYLPEDLYNLLINKTQNVVCDSPFIILENNENENENRNENDLYIKSIYSKIQLQVFKPNIKKLEEIRWTKSAADMADSILTSIASHTMLIFEGPPGRGKTAIAMAVYEALGIDYRRINLSPSTTEEDVFARTVPIVDKNNNIKTEILKGPLYQILSNSSSSIEHCRNGLILDEINLASNELLEQLYSFLTSLFYKNTYHTLQGEEYKIGNIGVIATMNDAKLSNARTTLSSNVLNLSHTFKLPNYEPEEMKILAENILGTEELFKKKEYLIRAITCFFNSQKYTKNSSETGGITLREILKLREFTSKCPNVTLDTLLDLVLCADMSEEDIIKFKNENQFSNILSDIIPEIKNNKLCFDDLIKYNLIKIRHNGPLNKQFTLPERDALMKILIGLNAKRTILLSGDIGVGKTHIIETLAEIIGAKLNVIQFNTDTSSSDTIGRLEMSIDSNVVSNIKNELSKLRNLLIEDEWPRITSFIKLLDEGTLNSEDIKIFFEKLYAKNPLHEEARNQCEICFNQLKISTLSCTNFEFKNSLLINAMENGEWVLIDDVNYAPQEIERLMSLLEENSSLTIYEQNPPVMYSREIIEDTDFIKHKQIHENFRLFVVTSNENVLSAAIKSRCLCVRLKPFTEAKHYAELLSSCLTNSYIPDNYIISTATSIGKAFYDIKTNEKENDYILKNYLLTPVNLINLSKIITNSSNINGKMISVGIDFSIFSMFKNKIEQYQRFKSSLSSEVNFNITTINRIMIDKKYILGMIEINILKYALKNDNTYKEINKSLNKVFENLYNSKRMANTINIIDKNENENETYNFIKNCKNILIKDLESFTLRDIEEYKEYIVEVLYILKELIPNKSERIYSNLYYLKYFNSLLGELILIKNEKIKGLKLNTIENTKEYFLQFGDLEDIAEDNAKILYWFRNAINGFNFLISNNVPTVDLKLSIISIYYNYYYEKYDQLEFSIKESISVDTYIHLKMLENMELRKILRKYNFSQLNKKIQKIFNILIYYTKPILAVIGESANGELTIEMGENIIIKINDKKYFVNNKDDIESLKKILNSDLVNMNNNYYKKIDSKEYADKYIDYIIPTNFKNNNEFIGGNIFWFYKLFGQKYLMNDIINNGMLCEFNDAIEYLLKFKLSNTKNIKGVWSNELEEIINIGYQLIYSLKYLKNSLWDNINNENKKENIIKFVKNAINIKKLSALFSACETRDIIIDNIIKDIYMIKNYFKRYEIKIWENMDLFINTCTSYINDEILKKKFENEKIEFVKQLNSIKNKIDDICNEKNKYKFNQIYENIEKLKNGLNEKDLNEINNEINEIEKMVNMFKIANESNIIILKKSQILSSNINNYDYEIDEYIKILEKYSKLCEIVKIMESINDRQLFINNMFRFCDISALEKFFVVYNDSLIHECVNNEGVSNTLIKELKHLVNSLLIIDIINICDKLHIDYKNYLSFIKNILKNDSNCIKSIGKYFGDDDYIYLPKLNIIDLAYCVRYGLSNKACSFLIKLYYIDGYKIRDPLENEAIEDYLKYLISICDKNIDCSGRIEDIIKLINKNNEQEKLKKTINNLYDAFKIINLFNNIKYEYNFNWLMNDIEKIKNNYWKEPGKIIIKKKFNSLLQFNDDAIFNEEKIIAKSLYATYEAKKLNEIHCKSKYLKELLTEILNNIYETNNNNYEFGYRTVSFYDKNIYKDNVAETMVTVLYSIFNAIESTINNNILDIRTQQIKNIIKIIVNEFIINCIKNKAPDIDNSKIIDIINILINATINKYKIKYEKEKYESEDIIRNNIIRFEDCISEIEVKLSNIFEEMNKQFLIELNEYNEAINDLKERFKKENTVRKFYLTLKNRFRSSKSSSDSEEEYNENDITEDEISNYNKKEYNKFIEEKTKEHNLKIYYGYTNEKPKDKKYDKKLQNFIKKCEELKKISNSNWKNIKDIINNNDISSFIEENMDDKYNDKYIKLKKELRKNIDYYMNITNNNNNLENILNNNMKEIQISPNNSLIYNIDEDINTLTKWIKELYKCKINMKINKYNEKYHKELSIDKPSGIYSANTNWIFDKENNPNFLLDNININLGIYILDHIRTKYVGSISFDNNCSNSVAYKLEQDDKNAIKAFTTGNVLKLQQNEPMNIKFRLNKELKENETIKCEFYIKLLNKNNEECDKCKVITYLNVIPLCIKFKLNEKYNLNENNISINHYINSLSIEHQYPGNYSSENLGITIKSNEENKYDKIKIEQKIGKIIAKFERDQYKLKCLNHININLNKLNLLHLNLNFITPKKVDYDLIIYDENGKNIHSIYINKGKIKKLYLFNMSFSPINITYEYNKNHIKLIEKINTINPGEKNELIIQIINERINSEKISINNKEIEIKILEKPELILKEERYAKWIYCKCSNKSIQNNLKLIYIDDKYKIYEKNNIFESSNYRYNNYLEEIQLKHLDSISSCYLIYNNEIISHYINENCYRYYKYFDEYDIPNYIKIFGFSNNSFCSRKYHDLDIILKFNSDYSYCYFHIFSKEKMEKIINIFNDTEFKNNLQSDILENVEKSINKLINKDFKLDGNIYENIENIEISKNKNSIHNILRYLIRMSKKHLTKDFINNLKNYLKIMFNREMLVPYFEVNNNINNNDIIQFLKKLSYIISFVDIVINPGILNKTIINYINSNTNNEISSINDKDLFDSFKNCFNNGLEKDKEDSELIYYDNKIYIHTEDDDFEKYNKQIENLKIDNSSYDKMKISDFIQTYKDDIQNIMNKITNNEINISNLFNTLDECLGIVSKIPLILSTITEKNDIIYCVSNCQKIYDFMLILKNSPIFNTAFSEKINTLFDEIHNILSKFEFFDLKLNKSNKSYIANTDNNDIMKTIIQCILPSDNTYENDLLERKKKQENYNQFIDINRKSHFDNQQYVSRRYSTDKSEPINNTNVNNDNYSIIDENKKNIHKIEYATVLTSKEREEIKIPFLNDFKEQEKDNNINMFDNNINDILDYENTNKEMKVSMDILSAKLDKTTPTEFLEMVMEKVAYINQSLSEIKLSKLKRKGLSENGSFNYYDECSQASSYIQSSISNLIKSNVTFIENSKLLPNSILDSYVDISVDITHMSQIQRITALVIATGLSIPLSYYGVNIRISVFGERNGIWLLSDNFTTNIEVQLARLRDALSSKKRFMSFPGDALYSLKNNWNEIHNNKQTKCTTNYTSVLISSLISPQVVNKQNNWSKYISNNIIVFGLKSEFDEEFKKKHNIYEELLKIPTANENQIIQEFLEPINVVCQNKSENNLLEKLCKALVTSCIYKLGDKDNFKEENIIINNNDNTGNEIISLKNISEFINNNMDDKIFFGQNISRIMTEVSKINEEFTVPKILLPSTNDLSRNIQNNDFGTIGSLKKTVESILKSQFGLAYSPNISAGKIPSASGGTISIPAIKKWIVSGFTYKEIFLKKAGKTKRRYSIAFAIDFSSSIHLSCNYSHAIATTLLLLIAPSTLQDNEEIKIDVIISTLNGPKVMYMSSKANTFESISCINSILNAIDKETPKYCKPGNILNAAYQLQLQKGGVGMGKNIFFITDGYVTSRKEIRFANSIIESCENAGIDLMTIGVGSYPYGIKQLYPKCCYTPSLRVLGDAIAFLFSLTRDPTSKEIIPQIIVNNTSTEIQNNLKDMITKEPDNKELQKSIEHKKMNYIEMMGNNNTMTLGDNIQILDENPEIEPYYDGLFKRFNILVIILYLGGYEYQGKIKDENITVKEFESGAGQALRKKGFNYTLVFSYGEAIDELTKSIEGRCPYIEAWMFCSRADGSLPSVATDNDSNKIIPFFKCITEFNNNGGGLLLFCDNEPFTLEANILLSEYLNFENENGIIVKPKFIMKGNYNQPEFDKKFIISMNPKIINESKNGKFKSDIKLPYPGECKDRISLRPGLVKFSEGITLSYAECSDKVEDYSPFIPFAYLTDASKERPFILYYDPKMKKDREINQGPIVVHGGFTSAFYDFSFDGTGRLVTSIACWLVRYEERIYRQINKDMKACMVKDIPAITIPDYVGETFTRWIKQNGTTLYSIMVLDVSGSMRNYYQSLINMANTIISNQLKDPSNQGTIIFFGNFAKAMVNGNYRLLTINDISEAGAGKGTNFINAFNEAVKYINPTGNYDDKRLLFLTDGEADINGLKPLCDKVANAGFSIHILGFGNGSTFNKLKPFVRRSGTFQVYSNFKDIESSAYKIFFAAE